MRHITHCPACETQFFVTDEQLNQYEGKVRCGQCLHVFNAKTQILDPTHTATTLVDESPKIADTPVTPHFNHDPPVALVEPFVLESASPSTPDYTLNEFDDFLSKTKSKKFRKPWNIWIWVVLVLIFLSTAVVQAVYYFRNDIALFYPATKYYLEQACQYLKCTIQLPKRIELIAIDDSDIQEDAEHKGLIWLSSTLINQAPYTQSFPNLELTLTDVEDQPKLRRIIQPVEYIGAGRDMHAGILPNEALRIRLAIDIQNELLAGYRVLVTY